MVSSVIYFVSKVSMVLKASYVVKSCVFLKASEISLNSSTSFNSFSTKLAKVLKMFELTSIPSSFLNIKSFRSLF